MVEKKEQLCVASTKTSEVHEDCSAELCMREVKKQLCGGTTEAAAGCALCPSNWLLYGDNCYYYSHDTRRTWDQSREQCEMMGGHLLVIEDQGQQAFIHRTVTQQAGDKFWIGLHHEGDGWRWVNGRRYNRSLFQLKVISGNCVLVQNSGYYSENCNDTHTFICQRKAVKI
ncbi:C-type lectin domain family 7 member A-like [Pseudophryne corroboree]|uniref:C-type lectin domain family 7 member A-like n=1 Tax=Pseudophryne corroboree TaxID=495146 RepID=UPI003081EB74